MSYIIQQALECAGIIIETELLKVLKAHRQLSKKRCLEKYCSCDKACQFSALHSDEVI